MVKACSIWSSVACGKRSPSADFAVDIIEGFQGNGAKELTFRALQPRQEIRPGWAGRLTSLLPAPHNG
jgi:hypothetical protein